MKIFRNEDTTARPADATSFIGPATTKLLASADDGASVHVYRVEFESGARTNWHSHEGGQVILIEKGHARVQEAGGAMREIGPRESMVTAAGVKHWHGATPDEGLTQVSLSFGATNWMEKVSDAQYSAKGK